MDVILPQSRTTTVEFYPPDSRPASATLRFLSPEGAELVAPTATVDTLSRTIVTTSDAEAYEVSGATGTAAAGCKTTPTTTGGGLPAAQRLWVGGARVL